MNLSTNDKICFTIALFLFWAVLVALIGTVFAQTTTQKVEEVKQEVQSNSAQIDSTTAITGVTAAGTIGTFLAAYMKSRKLEKEDRGTDRDVGLSILYYYRLVQTMDAYIPEVTKCLDQAFNSDPMQKHVTVRMKLADDANAWAGYLMTSLNTAIPSMTPSAGVMIAEAAASNKANAAPPTNQGGPKAAGTT